MKFGKLWKEVSDAQQTSECAAYLDYKHLKKMLKAMRSSHGGSADEKGEPEAPRTADDTDGRDVDEDEAKESDVEVEAGGTCKRRKVEDEHEKPLTKEEDAFVRTLDHEINRFNDFFLEKEEEYVIAVKHMEDRIRTMIEEQKKPNEGNRTSLLSEAIQLHGGMVMMLNWSMLNYAALVKILKKHDKYSGFLLRSDFLAEVVRQPFFSTDLLSRLIQRSECLITKLSGEEGLRGELPLPVTFQDSEDNMVQLEQIKMALDTWKKLRPIPGTPERCSPASVYSG